MIRKLPDSSTTYDVLVIGGGIYGLTVAADASQRGLSVALVERDDFGSGTSFNHLRTIHGGLRYLQTLDVVRARESIQERRTLARIAPEYVRPMPFVLPLTSAVVKGPLMMRAGFLLDALVASDRNQGVPDWLQLPAGQVIAAADVRRRFPLLGNTATYGAAVWHDYVTTEADRLTLSWALAAAKSGATLANHAEAVSLRLDGPRVVGARVLDLLTSTTVDASARVIVNATGADIDRLLSPDHLDTNTPMLRAMNLITRLPAEGAALGGVGASGRTLFMVPWRGRALFGTWESARACAPREVRSTAQDVAEFLADIGAGFPALLPRRDDITLVHSGVVPAIVSAKGGVGLQGRQQVRDHAAGGQTAAGLISVAGTKYTTARAVSEEITNRIESKLGRMPTPCRTATTALPLAEPWRPLAAEDASLAVPLVPESSVLAAQIVWAVKHEMAVTLPDVIVRRTPLGALGHPGRSVVQRAASVAGSEAGWDAQRTEAEVQAVDAFYADRV